MKALIESKRLTHYETLDGHLGLDKHGREKLLIFCFIRKPILEVQKIRSARVEKTLPKVQRLSKEFQILFLEPPNSQLAQIKFIQLVHSSLCNPKALVTCVGDLSLWISPARFRKEIDVYVGYSRRASISDRDWCVCIDGTCTYM